MHGETLKIVIIFFDLVKETRGRCLKFAT